MTETFKILMSCYLEERIKHKIKSIRIYKIYLENEKTKYLKKIKTKFVKNKSHRGRGRRVGGRGQKGGGDVVVK